MKNVYANNPISNVVKVLTSAANGYIRPCPYRIGRFAIYNYTDINADFSFFPIPNGEYKTIIKLSNDRDENIATFISKVVQSQREIDEFK